jgi:hypothetical protein
MSWTSCSIALALAAQATGLPAAPEVPTTVAPAVVDEPAPAVSDATPVTTEPASAPPVEATTATTTAAATNTTTTTTPSSARPWLNGSSHQRSFPLGSVGGVTPSLYVDVNTAFSLHQPEDHTLTGSGSVSRHNEVGLNMATAGVEWNVANVIGRLHLQFGNTLAMVQDGDGSVARGRTSTARIRSRIHHRGRTCCSLWRSS